MARIHEIQPEVEIHNNAERVIDIRMTQAQVEDALITWLRLKGVDLPSQDIKTYSIVYHLGFSDNRSRYVDLIHKQKL